MPRYTAVLDACVLVSITFADTLLRVAEKGLYRPLWSDRMLLTRVRLSEADVATMSREEAIARMQRYWAAGT
jgi:hypothetical protein